MTAEELARDQLIELSWIGYFIVGFAWMLYQVHTNPKYSIKDLWFETLYLWPYFAVRFARRHILWWRVKQLDVKDEKGFMRILGLAQLEREADPVNSRTVYWAHFNSGRSNQVIVTYKERDRGESPNMHPHQLAEILLFKRPRK